jgi:electron transport complex protein RnfG
MKGTVRLALTLLIVCGLAAGALSVVNAVTKERIAAFVLEEQQRARQAVFPGAEDFAETEPGRRWDALQAGQKVGAVVRASVQGYSGTIDVMVGVDAAGVVQGARVLTQTETPGLGAKIVEEAFSAQFTGRTADQVALRKDESTRGAIDAIAAATISSRAVTRAVRSALVTAAGGE